MEAGEVSVFVRFSHLFLIVPINLGVMTEGWVHVALLAGDADVEHITDRFWARHCWSTSKVYLLEVFLDLYEITLRE